MTLQSQNEVDVKDNIPNEAADVNASGISASDDRCLRLGVDGFSRHLQPDAVPLVVDLDGTLIRSDLLIEAAFSRLGRRPHAILDMLRALSQGKAALKHGLSDTTTFSPALLPYDPVVLQRIRDARDEGRPVYLASASHERLVSAVADHLGLFDGWFALDASINCAGAAKAERLVEAFGEGGFDYIGNDAADLPVWARARRAFAIRAPSSVVRRLAATCPEVEHLPHDRPTWRTWAKLLRVHQYAKNALLFVPLLTAHALEPLAFAQVLLAAVAFSLCASSVYLLNDLVDLQDDRGHRSKCHRPLANGSVPLAHAVFAIPLLLGSSMAMAAALSMPFFGVLVTYFAVTTAYSFWLKRKALLDVLALASLYTLRVVAGAAVLGITVSAWLLAFCLAIFLSLALIKRYVELAARLDAGQPDSSSRGYKNTDADLVLALAAAAGFNAVTVFILYASSDSVNRIYSQPMILWLVGPILTYWIARILMLAHRRAMKDDPVAFAITDRASLVCLSMIGGLAYAAT